MSCSQGASCRGYRHTARGFSCLKTIGDDRVSLLTSCFSNFASFIESSCIACGGNPCKTLQQCIQQLAEFSHKHSHVCLLTSKATLRGFEKQRILARVVCFPNTDHMIFSKEFIFDASNNIQSYTRYPFETLRTRILKCMK